MCICHCCHRDSRFHRKPIAEIVQNDRRRCTDAPCWLVVLVVAAIELYLIILAYEKGADLDSLSHGFDYKGNYCNSDNADGQLNAFVDPNESTNFRICVSDCSQTLTDDRMADYYESEEYFGMFCWSTDDTDDINVQEGLKEMQRGVADLDTAKYMIIISACLAVIFGFLYLKVVEYIGAFVIWSTIIAVYIGGIVASWLFIEAGIENLENSETEDTGAMQLSIGIGIALGLCILTCLLLWLRRRIELALVMLDQAGDAINDMPGIVLFPVLYTIPIMFYFTYWILEILIIYSVQEEHSSSIPDWLNDSTSSIKNENLANYIYYEFDDALETSIWIHFICLCYCIQLAIYFGFMVLSGAIADWYFSDWAKGTQDKKRRGKKVSELGDYPVIESFWRVLRYHVGSLAFGSLVIGIVRILKAIFAYAVKHAGSGSSGRDGAQNSIAKCMCCCVLSCAGCCETIITKVNKDGFIFVSIYGTNYCHSSTEAFKLVYYNIVRVVMVEGISKYMEFIGRFGIAILCTGISIIAFESTDYYQEHLSSYTFAAIIIFLITYLIGSLFMMVFEVAVDTIFLCFLVDETCNHPPRFASDALMHLASQYSRVFSEDENKRRNTR